MVQLENEVQMALDISNILKSVGEGEAIWQKLQKVYNY